jgi:hypothetical protein
VEYCFSDAVVDPVARGSDPAVLVPWTTRSYSVESAPPAGLFLSRVAT